MTKFSNYVVYVDESGDDAWTINKQFPILSVNYCLFEKEYYLDELIPRFNRLKFKYWGCDNIVLHERDLRQPGKIADPSIRSKYSRIKDERGDDFMRDLSGIIDHAEFKCFCVIIDKSKVPEQHRAFDPYHIALSRGFRQIKNYLKNHAEDELDRDLHFIFEKRDGSQDRSLNKAYQRIRLEGSLVGRYGDGMFPNFRLELMDKKSNSTGLQIADLTARPIGNHYLQSIGLRDNIDVRITDILLKKMHFCSHNKCEMGKYDLFHEAIL